LPPRSRSPGAGDADSAANNIQNLLSKIQSPETVKKFAKFGIDLPKALKKAAREGKPRLRQLQS
jgi:thiamine pyrophosphokinase